MVGGWQLRPRHKPLVAEAVQGAALALERVHDVEGRDGLAAGVLGVGHGVTDDILEEDLEHTAGLLVDETRDINRINTKSLINYCMLSSNSCPEENIYQGAGLPWELGRAALAPA